ncbi:hypothetical protein G6F40_014625 [Rhizopus arrhizus]|nr:hypothetical protein G6F40_014625 [Rhizopus arrhizus]
MVPSTPVASSHSQAVPVGQTQTNRAGTSDSGTQNTCSIWIATSELSRAAATATRLPAVKPAVPGRTITSTPMKPTTTAAQRRTRTVSPNHRTAAIGTNRGVE